jgi:ABC-type nitrate/sulfonate/bicarbonate transport system substrate-binding protein
MTQVLVRYQYQPESYFMTRTDWLAERRRLARAVVQAWAAYRQNPTLANKIAAIELETALADCARHL